MATKTLTMTKPTRKLWTGIEHYNLMLKESIDSNCISGICLFPESCISCLHKLRTELWKLYGIPMSRRISYVDEDGDDVPIDSECEYQETLKIAKNFTEAFKRITLIVGPIRSPINNASIKDEMFEIRLHEEPAKYVVKEALVSRFTKKNTKESIPKPSLEPNKQECINSEILSNQEKMDVKQYDESNTKQNESKNVEVLKKMDTLLGFFSDALPPSWFTEYMESMKKDMVSAITCEVVKNVTEILNLRLDSLASSPLKKQGEFRSQSHSSSSSKHLSCCSESNGKKQKKMRSQDEEQSSDTSIERVDEPLNANVLDTQTNEDFVSAITHEVVKEMTDMLDKNPKQSQLSKELHRGSMIYRGFLLPSKRIQRHFFDLDAKKLKKIRSQDKKHSNGNALVERTNRLQNGDTAEDPRQLQKKLDHIEDGTYVSMEEGNKKKRMNEVTVDDQDNDKEWSIDYNAPLIFGESAANQGNNEESSFDYTAQLLFNEYGKIATPKKNSSVQMDPASCDAYIAELREYMKFQSEPASIKASKQMSCSVTGHKILNEDRLCKDVWSYDDLNIDKASFWSCDQKEEEKEEKKEERDEDDEDDAAFEIIQMPVLGSDESVTHLQKPIVEHQQYDSSNRDSPSFELLSESPSSMCSMYINEDHFASDGRSKEQFAETKPSSLIYVVDINGKICEEYQAINPKTDPSSLISVIDINDKISKEYQAINPNEGDDLEKRSGEAYSFLADTVPIQEIHSSESSRVEPWSNDVVSDEDMDSPYDDVNYSYDDVRNSHASYLTVRTHSDLKTQSQRSCQSQTESVDFTQSFHSHTTSITDTNDIYTESYTDESTSTTNKIPETPMFFKPKSTCYCAKYRTNWMHCYNCSGCCVCSPDNYNHIDPANIDDVDDVW